MYDIKAKHIILALSNTYQMHTSSQQAPKLKIAQTELRVIVLSPAPEPVTSATPVPASALRLPEVTPLSTAVTL